MSNRSINGYIPIGNDVHMNDFQLIQENACPLLTSTPAEAATILTNDSEQYFGTNTLRCSYSPFTFRSGDAVDDFKDKFVDPYTIVETTPFYINLNEINYDNALLFLCSRLSDVCVNNTSYCSVFYDATEIGDYCRLQDESPATIPIMDQAKLDFCLSHDTSDCGCIRREVDPDYILIKQYIGDSISDNCWYTPCFESFNSYTGPIRLSTDHVSECSTTVCQQLEPIFDSIGSQLSENAINTIACFSNYSSIGSLQSLPYSKQGYAIPTIPNSIPSTNDALIWTYASFAFIAFVILVIIVMYFWYRKIEY